MTITSSHLSALIIDQNTLFSRLQAGHTLVTGNSRLARVLKTQYSEWRIEQGDRQWQNPNIVSWTQWLDHLWEIASLQGLDGTQRAVPASRQLINLWESVLRRDSLARHLLRPESLATQLRDTRRLIREWHVSLKDPVWLGDKNENHAAFYHWNQAFENRCRQGNWIAPEDRSALLCRALDEAGICTAQRIDLLGFDEFNPSQNRLLSALSASGNTLSRIKLTPSKSQAVLWQSKESKDELQQMARWVRYWCEKEPHASIAVVVPGLQTRRQEIERHLQEILTPGKSTGPQAWNISMGTPLAGEPLIQTAFDLLKLLDNRIDIQDIGRVLRSPWLRGGISERNSRALLEKCLRDHHPRQLAISEVRYRSRELIRYDRQHQELALELQQPQAWNSPKFSTIIDRLTQFQSRNKKNRPPSGWAEILDQLLASLGWPLKGESRTADPAEPHKSNGDIDRDRNWQALQAWRDGLRELASLDATVPELSCKAAIKQLQAICRETIFQALSPPTSIQVLGLYEISGLRFDHLWVLGLHNDNWPPAATPNPFIPGPLQRQAQLPHSSPQRELEVARTITERLFDTAPDCIFSYPGLLDGEAVLPSPLLVKAHMIAMESVSVWQGDSWQQRIAGADKPLTQPLLMPGEFKGSNARGGSSILKYQALCPFRAFATNRLAAESLETPADGISAMLHGSLIHQVLELFWQETRTQAALLQLDDEDLGARIRTHVNRVVEQELFLKQRPAFREVEAARLYRQTLASLELEKTRSTFEVVGFEKEILPVIKGQTIRLIIDRIDQIPSGEEIIIDYKTGRVDPKKWFGDRPEDPQLPLYAISAEKTPAAVVFSIIRNDGCLYKGVVRQEGLFEDLPPRSSKFTQELIDAGHAMSATIDNWRQILHRLMAAFLAGEAAIDPKAGRKTCETSYCDLQSLCRIGELEKIHKAMNVAREPETSA